MKSVNGFYELNAARTEESSGFGPGAECLFANRLADAVARETRSEGSLRQSLGAANLGAFLRRVTGSPVLSPFPAPIFRSPVAMAALALLRECGELAAYVGVLNLDESNLVSALAGRDCSSVLSSLAFGVFCQTVFEEAAKGGLVAPKLLALATRAESLLGCRNVFILGALRALSIYRPDLLGQPTSTNASPGSDPSANKRRGRPEKSKDVWSRRLAIYQRRRQELLVALQPT